MVRAHVDSTVPPPPKPEPTGELTAKASAPSSGRNALLVAAGIFTSRLFGLVRESVLAAFLGNSVAAAALRAGLKIPNFLQNLLGEGVLSGSFIPVYAGLLGRGEVEQARQLARAVLGLLCLVVAVVVALGVATAPWLVDVVAGGFEGEARELTILFVRILYPGLGLLVLSAWCLGILNSHRRFFLSYAAPVLYSCAFIAALLIAGRGRPAAELAEYAAWGAVAGCGLQFAIQLPAVARLLGSIRPLLSLQGEHLRQVLRAFGTVVVGRGVAQISAFVDTLFASLISARVFSALGYAQTLYMLPISLFGMAVSAAELPEMARAAGGSDEATAARLRARLALAVERISFFVVPSSVAFLLLGDVITGAVFQRGSFTAADTRFGWYLLIGSSVGLLAATTSRLYASAFYALKDPRTPLRVSVVRLMVSAALTWVGVTWVPGWLGVPRELGGVAIGLASGVGAWIELALLRARLGRAIGEVAFPAGRIALLWGVALGAAVAALAVKGGLVRLVGPSAAVRAELWGELLPAPDLGPVLTAAAVLGVYGLAYFGVTALLGVPQARAVVGRLVGRLRR